MDRGTGDARWFWINWDMDHSFTDFASTWTEVKLRRPAWEQEGLELVTSSRYWWRKDHEPLPLKRRDVRAILFYRLLDESPEYRRYFARLATDLLNHRITDDFLMSRVDAYEHMALIWGLKQNTMRKKRLFLKKRPHFIRKQIQEYLELGQLFRCNLNGPSQVTYTIDGYPEQGVYQGWYYKDQTITVEIEGSFDERFSHWLIDGQKMSGHRLECAVSKDMRIQPVFEKTLQNARF
ncbi:CotH kinase family protein [Acidobacteriota bacterium]